MSFYTMWLEKWIDKSQTISIIYTGIRIFWRTCKDSIRPSAEITRKIYKSKYQIDAVKKAHASHPTTMGYWRCGIRKVTHSSAIAHNLNIKTNVINFHLKAGRED